MVADLKAFNYGVFVFGVDFGEAVAFFGFLLSFEGVFFDAGFEFGGADDVFAEADVFGDFLCDWECVACEHFDGYAESSEFLDELF